ncbi:MAG: tetratricopeptide repeat protein, partial [Phycisphaerae bacterium]|nr:tetratricopeptide repeat protein [Phycisphaerae bacterium]
FHIWLCDKELKVIKDFPFPYSRFVKGNAKWVTLRIEPTPLPESFIICAGFNPERTKGVYVHYDESVSGNSFFALPGQKSRVFNQGEWMIHAVLSSPAIAPERAVRKVVIPDVDESAVMLDLASGRLVPIPEVHESKLLAAIEELDRGDLVYDQVRKDPILIFVRSAKPDKKLPLLDDFPAPYDIVSSPWPYTFRLTTKEGQTYEVTVLKAGEKGCEVKYKSVGRMEGTGKASDEDKRKAENIAAEGWQLWQQRKLVEAEEKFKQAIKKDPTNDNAFQGLGWAQLNQGKKLNAKESFEKCIEINPSNAAALNGLGWIAYGAAKKDEAITWWEKAITAAPGATASLSGLTKVYMERKDYGKAVKYYQMWLDVEPNSAEAKSGLEKAKSALQHK